MSTKTEPNRKTYDLEFKKQAVQLVISSGRPLTQIARELGLKQARMKLGAGPWPDAFDFAHAFSPLDW